MKKPPASSRTCSQNDELAHPEARGETAGDGDDEHAPQWQRRLATLRPAARCARRSLDDGESNRRSREAPDGEVDPTARDPMMARRAVRARARPPPPWQRRSRLAALLRRDSPQLRIFRPKKLPGRHAHHVARTSSRADGRPTPRTREHRTILPARRSQWTPSRTSLGPELSSVKGLADEVTGSLPAARRERHRAPGRAIVVTRIPAANSRCAMGVEHTGYSLESSSTRWNFFSRSSCSVRKMSPACVS